MCSIFGFCGTGGDIAEIKEALGKTHSRGLTTRGLWIPETDTWDLTVSPSWG